MRQGSKEWLAERKKAIGASDAPAVLGLSPWRTPLDVWDDKTSPVIDGSVETEPMRWGKLLEPLIRAEYERVTGLTVVVPDGIVRSETHPHMAWSPDGVASDGRIIEIKTARSSRGWGDTFTDEIPLPYLVQVHHALIVSGATVCDVPALIGGSDLRMYRVQADSEIAAMIVEKEAEFWAFVLARSTPPVTSAREAVRQWGAATHSGRVSADAAATKAWRDLVEVRAEISSLDAREDEAKATLMKAIADQGDTLIDGAGNILATWKLAKAARRLDVARLRSERPDVWEAYSVDGAPSRHFLLKGI